MKNNKKLIAIVAVIVLALIGLIVYIMKDSGDVGTTQNQNGQLVNFQGADLQEEKDGKLVWALSAEKIEYDPRTKAIVLTNLKGLFYQDDVTTTITAPHAVLTGTAILLISTKALQLPIQKVQNLKQKPFTLITKRKR